MLAALNLIKRRIPSSSSCNFANYFVSFRGGGRRFFHRTAANLARGIDEFFDTPENWGKLDVRTGRSWRLEELRLKSNHDLHKLWYVLLKERNMLLTMAEAAKRENELMPNPERADKVEESMERLQSVVRERNRAYLELERGLDGTPPGRTVTTMLGFHQRRPAQEHLEPAYMHPNGKEYETPYLDDEAYEFQKVWAERQWWKEFYKRDDEKRKLKKHKYLHRW